MKNIGPTNTFHFVIPSRKDRMPKISKILPVVFIVLFFISINVVLFLPEHKTIIIAIIGLINIENAKAHPKPILYLFPKQPMT